MIRGYVGDLRLLEGGTTDIAGNQQLLKKYMSLLKSKSTKEIPLYMSDLAELKSIYKTDTTAIDMKDTELAILGSERASDVPTMKTASDAVGTEYIEWCQNEINALEKQLKLMKQCKNLMHYYMNRKVDDLEAIDVLLGAYQALFMENIASV